MNNVTLSQILSHLHTIGFTAHLYKLGDAICHNGNVVNDLKVWLHCVWEDEMTDQLIAVYCCSNDHIQGTYIE